jgi:cellobiose transport system substrate-binding protein
MRRAHTGRVLAALCAALLAGTAVAGCGSDDDDSDGSSDGGKVTINVGLFGTFGFKEAGLYDEYERLHPNIKIVQHDTEKEEVYWPALQTRLAGGGGVDDIQGIEVGRVVDVAQNQADKWLDLNTLGAQAETADYLPWKSKAITTKDGKVLGLGTDVGPMAICYRKDLLQQAGLPTDRAELAQRWSTWEGYLELGRQFKGGAPGGSSWMDSATGMYNAMIGQQQTFYYDAGGKLIYDTNPAVKNAWDLAATAGEQGLTAKLTQFQADWNQAFAKGAFATISCPAWMIGYIKEQAGDAGNGKWDVAAAPGGTGNWGGSYLAIPKNAKHPQEAYDLLKWLTAKEQQITLFTKRGSFPSRVSAIQQVSATTDPYFSNAPIGQIFSASAERMPVQTLGVRDNDIKVNIQNGLIAIEAQGVKRDDAWKQARDSIKSALG